MLWTERDDETIRQCRRCLDNCKHYNTLPAAWFPLCIKMYEALRDAGLLDMQELGVDYCTGCAFEIGGGCKKAYAEATLDESRKRVIHCKQKTSEKQNAALERAAAKGKKRDTTCVSLAANRSRP